MVLLRLLADILLYLTFGLLVYWFFSNDITALWIAISSGIISALLFIYTADINRSRRYRHSEPSHIWDWFDFIDIVEIPLRLLWWLFSNIWRIFD
ncbi:hypothetical protein CAN34_01155 [Psychrobacter sp. DAB_AL32B]|nr:hypothetical protein CAN34_01155 [Psychrobacter sp. DAB_AL32B]SLJ85081.1 hypothetical protein DABAL43B_1887 [Psychrobacter sp. DAB_AL43B]